MANNTHESHVFPASVAVGAAGPCPTIMHGGREYSIGWPTQKAKARLEMLVAKHAWNELREMKEFVTADEYRDISASLSARISRSEHRLGGSLFTEVTKGPGGGQLFLLSLFQEKHPDITNDEVVRIAAEHQEEVKAAVSMVTPRFLLEAAKLMGASEQQAQAFAEKSTEEMVRSIASKTLSS